MALVPCRNCGRPVNPGAHECPYCLAPDPAPGAAAATAERRRTRGRRTLVAFAAAMVLVVAVVAAVALQVRRAMRRPRDTGPVATVTQFTRSAFCARHRCLPAGGAALPRGGARHDFVLSTDTTVALSLEERGGAIVAATAAVRGGSAASGPRLEKADYRRLSDFVRALDGDRCAAADSLVRAPGASGAATCGRWRVTVTHGAALTLRATAP